MENLHDLNEIVLLDQQRLAQWLASVRSRTVPLHNFNWLALAESIARRACTAKDINLARIAISVYEEMAQTTQTPGEKNRLVYSAMLLRSFFIQQFRTLPGDEVLDITKLTDWFESITPVSLDQAADLARHWQDLDIQTIRKLRDIKNWLQVFDPLKQGGFLDDHPAMMKWLSLRPLLP